MAWLESTSPRVKGGDRTAIAANFCNGGLPAQQACSAETQQLLVRKTSAGWMRGQAWIKDPKTANAMRFHLDPKYWSACPMYLVDAGRPLPGAPPLVKPVVTCT